MFLLLLRALAFGCLLFFFNSVFAQAIRVDSSWQVPDSSLLFDTGRPWWFKVQPSPTPTSLKQRPASESEKLVIEKVNQLMAERPAKAIALIDRENIIYTRFNFPANSQSTFMGYSVGKTITAMGVGQAICNGSLKLETKASELIPSLKDKGLGNASVENLLTMSSGTQDAYLASAIMTPDDVRNWDRGDLNLLELISQSRVADSKKTFFITEKPGTSFNYKSTDPYTLGIMVANATQMPFAKWLQLKVFDPAGIAFSGWYGQDKYMNPQADTGLRLKLDDWIRLAIWVNYSSKQEGCFGEFVRNSRKTKIVNNSTTLNSSYQGYGYLTWTDNRTAPDTVFAVGLGNQHIGWHTKSERIVIVFSNSESWRNEIEQLSRDWSQALPN